MVFEFDAQKSHSNKIKHGIDFNEAQRLWHDPGRVEISAKNLDEQRYMIIGRIDETIWAAVYTYRGKNIRIISVRKARENEKEIYESF